MRLSAPRISEGVTSPRARFPESLTTTSRCSPGPLRGIKSSPKWRGGDGDATCGLVRRSRIHVYVPYDASVSFPGDQRRAPHPCERVLPSYRNLALESLTEHDAARPFVEAALELLNKVTDLSKNLIAHGGRARFVVQPLNVSDLVRDIEGRITLPDHVKLVLELRQDLPLVQADAGQIQDLLMSLLSNAVEAIGDEPDKSISIRANRWPPRRARDPRIHRL